MMSNLFLTEYLVQPNALRAVTPGEDPRPHGKPGTTEARHVKESRRMTT